MINIKKVTLFILLLMCVFTSIVYADGNEMPTNVDVYKIAGQVALGENDKYTIEDGTLLPVINKMQNDGTKTYYIRCITIDSANQENQYKIMDIDVPAEMIENIEVWVQQDIPAEDIKDFSYESVHFSELIYGIVNEEGKMQIPILSNGFIHTDAIELNENAENTPLPTEAETAMSSFETMDTAAADEEILEEAGEDINLEKILINFYIVLFLAILIYFVISYRKGSTMLAEAIKYEKENRRSSEKSDSISSNLSNEVDKLKRRVVELEENTLHKKESLEAVLDVKTPKAVEQPRYTIYVDFNEFDKEKILIKFNGGINSVSDKMYVHDKTSDEIEVENEFTRISAMTVRDNYLSFFYEPIQFPGGGGNNSSYELTIQKKPRLKRENNYYIVSEKGIIIVKG